MLSRLIAVLLLLAAPVLAAPDIRSVPLGPQTSAWLVEDHSAPVVTVQMVWRWAGGLSEPSDLPGIARFAMGLMDEGAGELDSAGFQGLLDDLNGRIGFSAGAENITLTLSSLSANLSDVVRLSQLALTRPRFDADAVERVRDQLRQSYARSLENGGALAGSLFNAAAFAGHPLAAGDREALAALDRITVGALRQFVETRLTRANLLISAAGAVAPARLTAELGPLLAALPDGQPLAPPPAAPWQAGGQTLVLTRPLPQSTILFAAPGVTRRDPDYLAAALLTHTLGGGSFTSRLKDAVREKQGLAYSISAGLAASQVAPILSGGASTANDKAALAVETIRKVLNEAGQTGITADELRAAQDYLVGALPLRLDSTGQIAGTLMALQSDGLPQSYLEIREAEIRAVSLDQVNRLARQLLDPARLTLVVVGQPVGLTATTNLPIGF